jgi:hypothetical protein
MSKVLANEELGEIWEEAAMAYFEVTYWNLSGETETIKQIVRVVGIVGET